MRYGRAIFEAPHAVTYLLIALNAAMFGVCLLGNSPLKIDGATLLKYGAIYPGVIAKNEYWRFAAAAFLHVNALHLLLNMICLAAWGGILEQRVGASYFLLIYLASAVGGNAASFLGHTGPFLSVGASGAISGVLGALLCLTILGKLRLSAQFFIVTIGVNGLLAARAAQIDWMAHLGGLAAGLAACAILDVVEAINRLWLRCKFPEFAKFAITLLGLCGCLLFLSDVRALLGRDGYAVLAAFGLALILLTKSADLMLGQTKGLAVVVLAVASINALIPVLAGHAVPQDLAAMCLKAKPAAAAHISAEAGNAIGFLCQSPGMAAALSAVVFFVATMVLLQGQFRRGLADAGFVPNALRAERNRRHGL